MRPRLRTALANLGLFAATVLFFLLVVEVGLRASGFAFVLYPERVEFGKPDPVLLEKAFRPDRDLFWVTKDYPEKLERLRRERPALVFMGDSCTQFGRYDEALARIAASRGENLSFGNVGVAGWTTYQGLRQLERDVLPLAPRRVTIYFGWNDHWIGFGIEDKNVARAGRLSAGPLGGLRLVQLVTKGIVAWGTRRTEFPERVSLADFAANLRRMVVLARAAGVEPALLTAPSSIRAGAEPGYLEGRWVRRLADVVPLHRAYADAVRTVAAAEGATLCDLARDFDELPRAEVEAAFMADGIHLTAAGNERLAAFLDACLRDAGLLSRALPRGLPS